MRYILAGSSLSLDRSRCNGCGRCVEVCPHAVFALVARRAAVVARGNCMQCGACRLNCADGAIAVASGVGCAQAVVNGMRSGIPGECNCC